MKATGIVRRIDDLGRIVIPKEIRKIYDIQDGEVLEIYTEQDKIVLKKFSSLLNKKWLMEIILKQLTNIYKVDVLLVDRNDLIISTNKTFNALLDNKEIKNMNDKNTSIPIEIYYNDLEYNIKRSAIVVLGDYKGTIYFIAKDKKILMNDIMDYVLEIVKKALEE